MHLPRGQEHLGDTTDLPQVRRDPREFQSTRPWVTGAAATVAPLVAEEDSPSQAAIAAERDEELVRTRHGINRDASIVGPGLVSNRRVEKNLLAIQPDLHGTIIAKPNGKGHGFRAVEMLAIEND